MNLDCFGLFLMRQTALMPLFERQGFVHLYLLRRTLVFFPRHLNVNNPFGFQTFSNMFSMAMFSQVHTGTFIYYYQNSTKQQNVTEGSFVMNSSLNNEMSELS